MVALKNNLVLHSQVESRFWLDETAYILGLWWDKYVVEAESNRFLTNEATSEVNRKGTVETFHNSEKKVIDLSKTIFYSYLQVRLGCLT